MVAPAPALSGTLAVRLSSLSRGRAALWFAAVLAALAGTLTLDVGLATDDYAHRQFVRAQLASEAAPGAPWVMFDLGGRGGPVDIALRVYSGLLPWWSSPSLKVAFFRPLAVAAHFVDGLLWPQSPWLMHLHNALWYVGLCVLVAQYLRRVMGASLAAGFAAALYAVDEAHVEGLAWIASRNTLMAAFFAVGALVAHERARASGRTRLQLVAALSLALGLASGEGAIAVWPYLLGHALFVDHGRPAARVLGLVPLAAVTLAWQALYRGLGYGARGSGVYFDPFAEPQAFAAALPVRALTALQEQLAVPAWAYELLPARAHVVLDAGCLLMLVLALLPLWRLLRARADVRLLMFGMLGSLLPVCSIPPAPRLLFMVGVGGAGLLAELIVLGATAFAERARRGLAGVAAPVVLGALLLAVHAVAAPLVARSRALTHAHNDRLVRAASASLASVAAPGATLVVLATDNYFLTLLALAQRTWDQPALEPTPSHVLCASAAPVRLTRRSSTVLVLAPQGGYLREPWSHLVRSPSERFTPGQAVLLSIGSATVEAVSPDGRPERLRLELPDAEAPALVFIAWERARQRFVRVTLPEVGTSIVLGGT